MLHLPDVTLLGVDNVNYERLAIAATKCFTRVKFGDVRIYSSIQGKSLYEPPAIVKSRRDYSTLMVRHLHEMFDTKFVLVIQWDGYILNPKAWDEIFLRYDYIGARWDNRSKHSGCVGNGGFSLRSKKFCRAAAKVIPPGQEHCEDIKCCIKYRSKMESEGVRFAPPAVADMFSKEMGIWNGEFGFHHSKTDISRAKHYA